MRVACSLVMALSLFACKGEPSTPVPPANPGADAAAVEMRAALADAGIEVTETKRLAARTAPSVCREEWRYRLSFGENEFLNVSRFPDAAAAEACLDEYRQQVAKGGPAAIDRLMPYIGVDGRYLFQFSETTLDAKRREEILAAAKKGLAASER